MWVGERAKHNASLGECKGTVARIGENTHKRCGTVGEDVKECIGGQCVPSTERFVEETYSNDL